ncbi:MAG: 2-hydroxycarboxylate transporter family protein [Lachnospiraceae bacterium]|nr:2-hydroxycarboxylate transporter family protein [Lachnospiraceae bacterium]
MEKVKETCTSKKPNALFFGIPIPVFIAMLGIILAMIYLQAVPNTFTGALGVLLILSLLIGEVGDRIPIWNTYVGGGAILCFLVGGIIFTYNLVPEQTSQVVINFFDEFDYLGLYVSILITGSVLSVNRKMLLKSLAGYFPAILGGIFVSTILGCIAGLLVGKDVGTIVTMYVLPIMGGGTGAGALPMSEIYASVTGNEASSFLSLALPILTIANIICIIIAAFLNHIGEIYPKLTGNGELMKTNDPSLLETTKDEKVPLTASNIAAGLALAVSFFALGRIFSEVLLPTVFGISIHNYAYMVIFVCITNILNIIPNNLKQGAKALQSFFADKLLWMQMFAVGMALTDFNELLGAFTLGNIIIALFIVIGAFLGSAAVGVLFKFYPIESGLSAGLCMANRVGSGDIAVLGAAKRMNLMSYAQISSRLGGGIMLVLASVGFSFFL